MKYRFCFFLFVLLGFCAFCNENSLVFEVIARKPQEARVTYEKKMNQSSSKFEFLGNAFLMSDKKFYSVAHIFNLLNESVYTDYFVRSSSGDLFQIDKVLQLSTKKDFVVFTVCEPTEIIRTDDLPQDENILEKYSGLEPAKIEEKTELKNGFVLPFNQKKTKANVVKSLQNQVETFQLSVKSNFILDGAPFLNDKNQVIGIVLGQNQGKFDFLPMAEILKAQENTIQMAKVHETVSILFPNIKTQLEPKEFNHSFRLPLGIKQIKDEIKRNYSFFVAKSVEEIKSEYSATGKKGFLRADGAEEILSSGVIPEFPYTIGLSEKGRWGFYLPEEIKTEKMPDGTEVFFGGMNGYTHALIKKNKNLSYEELITSPKLYMDYILKATDISRTFESETVAFTSFGEPYNSEIYIDAQKRTWFVSYWELTFSDLTVVTFALPLPDGLYVMMDIDSTGSVLSFSNYELKFACDCVYARYVASIGDWKEFLKTAIKYGGLVSPLDSIEIDLTDEHFVFTCPDFEMIFEKELLSVTEETIFRLALGYNKDFSCEIRTAEVFNQQKDDNYKYLCITKSPKPGEKAYRSTKQLFEMKRDCVFPFDGTPYNIEDYTYCDTVLFPTTQKERDKASYIYTYACELFGQDKDKEIKNFANRVKKCFSVY